MQELNIDKLTGCLNLRAFEEDLVRMLNEAEEKNSDLTLVVLDLDNFKTVNDTFGHDIGDLVLKETANILLGIFDEYKTYRYSGDSFTLIFPDAEKEQVFLMMEEARKKIAEAPECSRASSTISTGIATYSEDGI